MSQREIDEARRRLQELERKQEIEQRTCVHDWGEPFAVYNQVPNLVFKGYEGCGSDPYPRYERCGTKREFDGYQRQCTKCGKVEKTKKTKVVKSVPDFG